MKYFIRIISLILVFVICLGSFSFAFAAESGTFVSSYDFWGWLADHTQAFWDIFCFPNVFSSLSDPCTLSDDGRHHASSGTPYRNTPSLSGGDIVYLCHCDYCGHPFDAHVSIEDLKRSYDEAVGNTPTTGGESGGIFGGRVLPVNIIQKDGILLWSPTLTMISFYNGNSNRVYDSFSGNDLSAVTCVFPDGFPMLDSHFSCYPTVLTSFKLSEIFLTYSGSFPLDGFYSAVPDSVIFSFSTESSISSQLSSSPEVFSGLNHEGSSYSSLYSLKGTLTFSFLNCRISHPVYKVTPLSGLIDTQHDEIYSPDTRATSFTGDIGIIGDDGQLTKVEGDQIFNETTNNYYNPTTGNTTTVTDWFYDYSDRSYHLTTQEGDTVTVTYGDENITIQEGDQTYNVYYITTYNVSEGDIGEDGHIHQWGEPTDSTPATCTNSGSETYTCSVCGESKTVQIPALGHKWKVLRTVQTKYDESGELVQQGYTLYECERCGEQYKQDGSSTGPPGTGQGGGSSGSDPSDDDGDSIWDKLGKLLGTLGNGALELIGSLVSKLLDGLISLAELIAEKLVDVVNVLLNIFDAIPGLFSGFLDFLSAVFPFLPSEIMLLLTFGMAAIVFIGIIKAVRR